MIDAKIAEALNEQYMEELKSAYLYDSMAADLQDKHFTGMAAWLRKQASEERSHAEKIHRYLDERGTRVYFKAMEEPQAVWDSPQAAFEAALKHERFITGCIHNLVKKSRDAGDLATENFLMWFVKEQVEEESISEGIVDKFKIIGDKGQALYMLDRELAARQ